MPDWAFHKISLKEFVNSHIVNERNLDISFDVYKYQDSPCFFLFFKRTSNAWCKVLSFWSAVNPRDNSDSESDCFGIGFIKVNLEVVL